MGAQRASQSKFNQGQVAQIRFRVLNHVAQDGSRPMYDLMNPVIVVKDEAIVNEHQSKVKRSEEKSRIEERKEFIDYINELLDNRKSRHEITRRESEAYDEKNREIEEASMSRSCSQIVSRLTHGSRKGKL